MSHHSSWLLRRATFVFSFFFFFFFLFLVDNSEINADYKPRKKKKYPTLLRSATRTRPIGARPRTSRARPCASLALRRTSIDASGRDRSSAVLCSPAYLARSPAYLPTRPCTSLARPCTSIDASRRDRFSAVRCSPASLTRSSVARRRTSRVLVRVPRRGGFSAAVLLAPVPHRGLPLG